VIGRARRAGAAAGVLAACVLFGAAALPATGTRGAGDGSALAADGAAFAGNRVAVAAPPTADSIVLRLAPDRVIEGTLFTVTAEGVAPEFVAVTGSFGGEPLHFEPAGDGVYRALAAAPLDSAGARPLQVVFRTADDRRVERVIDVPVAAGEYRMERLSVAPQFGQPQPAAVQRRIAEEAARARAVSAKSHETPRLWEPPFIAPRESRITSGFGHGRTFNGQVQSRHTGTDYAGAVGTPIRAPARGRVALIGDFYLGGGVLYIDHGAGLVTGYLHLSGVDVAEGDLVERGQVIARVGATGRVTGPHLHWIVRYGGHTVDALSLLALSEALDW
jgi:murein DD-endopeptidase MepM/ murein hydrolase activator NlpD